MNEKVKEIKRAEKLKKSKLALGIETSSISSAKSISSNNVNQLTSVIKESFVSVPKHAEPTKVGGGKALKLGNKVTNDDIFIQKLKNEGQDIASINNSKVFIN